MQIDVRVDETTAINCQAVILVPEIALTEAGHIRTFAAHQTGQSKHEFHALGQMALMQVEDGEITPAQVTDPIAVRAGEETAMVEDGIVICRALSGELNVLANTDRPVRRFLETANRFCTRWIRLDI